jgi:uncharacterized protein
LADASGPGAENEEAAGPRPEVPWTAGDAVLGIVLLIPALLVLGGIIFAAGSLIFGLLGVSPPPYFEIATAGTASFIASVGLAWWLGIKRARGRPADLGLANMRLALDLPLALLGEFVVFIALAVYSLILIRGLGLSMPEQPVVEMFGRQADGIFMAVLFIVVLAPIGEEIFFRGFLYTAFRRRWGLGPAMAISSGVFAVFHLEPLLFVPMFIIGLILAALFEYRRSLAPAIFLHAINNLIALVTVYRGGVG